MLIDWYTVAAQIINFLVLVFLLKHFLYGRIIAAMDGREKRIADSLREAEEEKAKAQGEADAYRVKLEELERRRNGMMAEAKKEVDRRRSDLEKRAKDEVEQARDGWYEAIEREREGFLRTVRETLVGEVAGLVRRVLSDLADADLERQMVRSFVSRLERLDREQLERVAAGSRDKQVTVRSAFPLGEKERTVLQKALSDRLGAVSADYVTNGNIGLGIIMEVPGLKVGWTIEDYINDLEKALSRASEPPTAGRGSASRQKARPEEGTGQDTTGGSGTDGR
jgi:F-type H+-transporting ATPase subunit b